MVALCEWHRLSQQQRWAVVSNTAAAVAACQSEAGVWQQWDIECVSHQCLCGPDSSWTHNPTVSSTHAASCLSVFFFFTHSRQQPSCRSQHPVSPQCLVDTLWILPLIQYTGILPSTQAGSILHSHRLTGDIGTQPSRMLHSFQVTQSLGVSASCILHSIHPKIHPCMCVWCVWFNPVSSAVCKFRTVVNIGAACVSHLCLHSVLSLIVRSV